MSSLLNTCVQSVNIHRHSINPSGRSGSVLDGHRTHQRGNCRADKHRLENQQTEDFWLDMRFRGVYLGDGDVVWLKQLSVSGLGPQRRRGVG